MATPYYTKFESDAQLASKIDAQITNSTALSDPTVPIVELGNVHILGVGPGTYPNWGGMIIPAENIGTLQRVDGVYSVSLTPIDLSGKVNVSDVSELNITNIIPLAPATYYTLATAIAAVPVAVKKTGLKLTFEVSIGVWQTFTFNGLISDWAETGLWQSSAIIYKRTKIKDGLLPSADTAEWLVDGVFTIPPSTNPNGKYYGFNYPIGNGHDIYIKVIATHDLGDAVILSAGNGIANVFWKLREDGRYEFATNIKTIISSFILYFVNSITNAAARSFYYEEISKLEFQTIEDAVNEAQSSLLEVSKPTYTIVTAKRSGTADFVGRTAIQDAIDSITDATEQNQYIIKATGIFECAIAADYIYDIGSGFYQLVTMKHYIHLDGGNRDNCIITCSLPDNLGLGFPYQQYQSVWWNEKAEINNVTILGKNIRYPLHNDGGAYGNENYKHYIKNSTIWHQGNTNDALAVWNIGTAFGLGTSSGQEIVAENCTFRNPKTGLYAHDNANFNNSCSVTYINCEVISDTGYTDGNIVVESLGSGVKNKVVLQNCNVTPSAVKINCINISKTNLFADNANFLLETDLEPRAVRNYQMEDVALMFKTILTGASASVSFVSSSSAFNDLIGDSTQTVEFINRYGFKQLKGYSYRNGINGLVAFAYGFWNVKEPASSGDYLCALGKRLGDCSSVNKTLGIIINGTTYNVVFDKNYNGTAVNAAPNYTNATIIAEINAVIDSVATCSTYAITKNYYPKFKGVETRVNSDSSECLSGMGIVFLADNGFRKALNADGYIDGIALDDSGVGEVSRIITQGEIYSSYLGLRFSVKEATGGEKAIGTQAGISATAGVFDVNATPKVLICKQTDIYKIIK